MLELLRRLAHRYREAALWQQLAVPVILLVVFSLAETPWVLAGTAALLCLFFYLSLDLGLLLIAAIIPFAFAYKHIGAEIISPLEMLTLACFVAWCARRMRSLFAIARHFAGGQGCRKLAPGPAQRDKSVPHVKRTLVPAAQIARFLRGGSASGLDLAVLCFVAVAALSLVVAEDKGTARWELRILIIEPVLAYVMIRASGLGRERLLGLADALAAGAVAVSVVGLYQYFFTDYVEAVQGVRRILSIYDSPNHLSLFLGRVVPISFCLAAFGAGRWRRLYHGLALAPVLLCLYLTYSRGAWLLGLPAALIFIGLLRGGRGRALALGALALALLALVPILSTPRLSSLLSLQSGTNFLRLALWQGAVRMIAAHPLWGVGLGNFVRWYPRYRLPEGGYETVQYHPHNLLLDTWTALGIPGLVVLASMQAAFFRLGLSLYGRLRSDPGLRALTLGLMASMVDFLAHGLVDTGFRLTDLSFVMLLAMAMLQKSNDLALAAKVTYTESTTSHVEKDDHGQ